MRAMRRRARLMTAAAGLALLAVVALPSRAPAGTPSVRIDDPSSGAVIDTSGFSVSGTVSTSDPQGTIDGDLELIVTSQSGHPGYSTTESDWCGRSSCGFQIAVPPLAWNGAYSVAIQATERDPATGDRSVTATSSVALAVPPATPADVKAAPPSAAPGPDGTQASVTLSWDANKEPDLIGYEVTRSPAGTGTWPKAVTSPSFVDQGAQAGQTYSYTVAAVRQGGDTGSTVSSAGASVSATVPSSGAALTGSSSSSPTSGRTGGASAPAAAGADGGKAGRSTRSSRITASTPPTTSDLAQFNSLLAETRSASGLPALPAPQAPGSAPPTTSSPAHAGPAVAAIGPLPPPRDDGGGSSQLQTAAALALVALMAAVATHLLWLRRQAAGRPGP